MINEQALTVAAIKARPLDIGFNQDSRHNKIVIESLEGQVLHYIKSRAEQGETISVVFLKDLFFQARKMLR